MSFFQPIIGILLLVQGVASACTAMVSDSIPYNLSQPERVISLAAPELREISGLSLSDQPGVYLGISDEKGVIYFLDGQKNGEIIRQVAFKDKGDFEGVEFVGGCLYAIKSDGNIFEIDKWTDPTPLVNVYKNKLKKADDIEGLCFDADRKSLLLASKGNPDSLYARKIYAFDLISKKLIDAPVYSIDPAEIDALVPRDADTKPDYFSPSGIAIHPYTKDIYVISSAKKRLVVLDYITGKVKFASRLSKKIFPQPEGIAFAPDGSLLISSEGKEGNGLILIFKYIVH